MAFLPAKSFRFDDCQALQADFMQRVLYLIKFEGLDNGFDFLHRSGPIMGLPPFHARRRQAPLSCGAYGMRWGQGTIAANQEKRFSRQLTPIF